MRWTAVEQAQSAIVLPDQLTPGLWLPAKVGSESCEFNWQPALRTLFVRESPEAPERALRFRTVSMKKYQDGGTVEICLELVAQKSGLPIVFRAAYAMLVPGVSAQRSRADKRDDLVQSPMVGKILKVCVELGQNVARGSELLVIEAMKMENRVFSKKDGRVSEIYVKADEQVKTGQALLKLE